MGCVFASGHETESARRGWAGQPRAAIPRLLAAVALMLMIWATPPTVDAQEILIGDDPQVPPGAALTNVEFQLAAFFTPTNGFLKDAAWLNDDEFLSLVLAPSGASIWRYSYSQSSKEKFLSSQFITANICPVDFCEHLSMTVSPGKRYMFLNYFDDSGVFHWTLLDIADAPNFRIRRFDPPPGMQIRQVLFSPDDRYGVFLHDSFQEPSEVTFLILDLESGEEYWRIGSAELGFVSAAWWRGAIYSNPRFEAVSSFHNGEFQASPGVALCDIGERTVQFSANAAGVLLGSEAIWGRVTCNATGLPGQESYFLAATVPGQVENQQVPLTASPVGLRCLAEPGLVLLSNTEDRTTNQLWLLDVISARRQLVNRDCADFDLSLGGKLLIRTGSKNEIRVYDMVRHGTGY